MRRASPYPYLWSWGGNEVEADGKTVVLNSKGSINSVKFMTDFWKEALDEGGLAWDDTSNNRAFLSGTICATLNGASIYLLAKSKPDTYLDEKGKPMFPGHGAFAPAQGPRRAVRLSSADDQHADGVFEEPEGGERFSPLDHLEGRSIGSGSARSRAFRSVRRRYGRMTRFGTEDPVMLPFRAADARWPFPRLCRSRRP